MMFAFSMQLSISFTIRVFSFFSWAWIPEARDLQEKNHGKVIIRRGNNLKPVDVCIIYLVQAI